MMTREEAEKHADELLRLFPLLAVEVTREQLIEKLLNSPTPESTPS